MRSNSAIEDWISVETWSIEPIGKNSRDCSVVNATIVPAVSGLAASSLSTHPATRYTSAGVIEKNVPTTAKNERPIIVWRICSPVSRSFSPWNRSISWRCRPNDFDSRMPETDSVSSVTAVRSAIVFAVLVATSRRARPTLTVSQTKNGIMNRDSTVSCHDRSSIAISVLDDHDDVRRGCSTSCR